MYVGLTLTRDGEGGGGELSRGPGNKGEKLSTKVSTRESWMREERKKEEKKASLRKNVKKKGREGWI